MSKWNVNNSSVKELGYGGEGEEEITWPVILEEQVGDRIRSELQLQGLESRKNQ